MNDLTTIDTELAILDSMDTSPAGLENLEPGDIGMPPRLRISQQNRPIEVGGEQREPGTIVNMLTGEVWNDLEIVPIVFLPRTRLYWPETFNADNNPICLSDDGKMPSLNRGATDPQPGPCKDCPCAKFVNGEKPQCSLQRNFLVWLVAENEPAILTLSSTGLRAAKKLTALSKMQGLRKSIIFSTAKVSGSKGTWFEPTFARGTQLAADDVLALVVARDELKLLTVEADEGETFEGEQQPAGAVQEVDEIPF